MTRLMTQNGGGAVRVMALTDSGVLSLPRPSEVVGRYTVKDLKVPQLQIIVGPRSKSFSLHATVRGKTHRVGLGRHPVVSVDGARQAAIEGLRRLWTGQAVEAAARPAAAPTLRQVRDDYLSARSLRPASARDIVGTLDRYARAWLDEPFTFIEPAGVAAACRALTAQSPASAAKLLRHLGAVMRYGAALHGGIDAGGCMGRVQQLLGGGVTVAPRDRVVPEAAQGAWAAAVRGLEDSDARRLLLALALTGCRKEELRLAESAWWDRGRQVLTIPAAVAKGHKDHAVPVTPALAALLGETEGCRLFDVGESTLRTAVDQVARAVGIKWTCHDLRRGLVTSAVRLGVPELIVKRLVGHAAEGVTQRHYLRLSVDDVRPAAEQIAQHFNQLWGAAA